MRRRLLFLLPDLSSARRTMDDLLLARIEERHIHFIAREGVSMDGLHDASVLQRSDIVHAAQQGLLLGAVFGCALGGFVVITLAAGSGATAQISTVLGATAAGALLGTWASSMAGAGIPNSRLTAFATSIAAGKVPQRGALMNRLRWQDAVNLVLGAWTAGSPWILGFPVEMPAARWNALVVGLLIVLIAATDLDAPASWEAWALGALGLGLVVAPWIFGYAANSAMTASSVVTGALVMALAAWTLYVASGFPHRRGTAH